MAYQYIKKPCFDYQTKTQGKEKNYGLTPGEIRPLYEYARKRYLDNGVAINDAIDSLVRENPGSSPRFWQEVIAGPKGGRGFKSPEMFAKEDARQLAKMKMQDKIEYDDANLGWKLLRAGMALPRAALTAFHGGVFPVTHGGALILSPTKWGVFWRGWKTSWASASRTSYEHAKRELFSQQNAKDIADWRSAGLIIGPNERPQGILSGIRGSLAETGVGHKLGIRPDTWADRAWLGLMQMRFELAQQSLKRFTFSSEADRLETMRGLARIANHATGVTNFNVLGPYLSKGLFAPQLTMSKLMRASRDPVEFGWVGVKHPIDAIKTISNMLLGKKNLVSAPERAVAYTAIRNAMEYGATSLAGLYLNDQLMQMAGSKQRINFLQPWKSDWLRFKSGVGDVFTTRGPEEFLRLYGMVASLGWREARGIHGKNPFDEAANAVSQFLMHKIAPGVETSFELGYGTDIFGRALPPQIQKARGLLGMTQRTGTVSKAQYTMKEWLLAQHAPIFVDGGAKDIYDEMRERGLDAPTSNILIHGAIASAGEFLGIGTSHERAEQPEPTRRGYRKYHGALAPGQ